MKVLLFVLVLFPAAAMAANDERSRIECLDELQKFEFAEVSNEIVPDSFWQSVSFQHAGEFYSWDGKVIVKKIIGMDRYYQSINHDEKLWSRARANTSLTGKDPKTSVATEDMFKVMDSLISQTLTNFHKRFNSKRKYTQLSVAGIVNKCANVDGAKVRIRNRWITARKYQELFQKFRPQYFVGQRTQATLGRSETAVRTQGSR